MIGIRIKTQDILICEYCDWPPEGWKRRYDGSYVQPTLTQILRHILDCHPEKIFERLEALEHGKD